MYRPTHLSLFALRRADGRPISDVPFYAEVVATAPVEEQPVTIDGRFADTIAQLIKKQSAAAFADAPTRDRIVKAVSEAISRIISQEGRDQLATTSKEAQTFIGDVLLALGEAIGGLQKSLPAAAMRNAVEESVRNVATGQKIALTPPTIQPAVKAKTAYPLGTLATNHVGYLSFDLTRLPSATYEALVNAIEARRNDNNATLDVSVWFYALARDALRFDALEQGRFAEDAILTKLELDIELPPIAKTTGFLSMQNPSLTDWRISSASFATSPSALIGDDEGCENLLPAHVAMQEYRFYQVVRLVDIAPPVAPVIPGQVQLGIVNEYRVSWNPLGHSLGQILYSLPLAPGESVNLAVIDWTRGDDAQRKEHTTLDEQIVHQEHRDRSISETVDAAIQEYQHGSSFVAGEAQSAGASGSVGVVGLAVGNAFSLGGSTASASGTRNIAATTVQKLSDNITQASSAMRELQSTVVVHSTQSEREAIETRTVVNYNHSHALTILYYEVLRHFRVVTEFVRRRPAVLTKIKTDWFQGADAVANIIHYRGALSAALLDARLTGGFDAIEEIARVGGSLADLSKPLPAPPYHLCRLIPFQVLVTLRSK